MLNLKFKSKGFGGCSWHYRLATEYGDMYKNTTHINLCSYLSYVVKGLLIVFCITFTITMILMAVLFSVIWAIICLQYSYIPPDAAAIIGFVVLGCAVGIPLFIWLCCLVQAIRTTVATRKHTDSFIVNAFISLKEKTCRKVVFVDYYEPTEQTERLIGVANDYFNILVRVPAYVKIKDYILDRGTFVYDYTNNTWLKYDPYSHPEVVNNIKTYVRDHSKFQHWEHFQRYLWEYDEHHFIPDPKE